MPVEGTGLRGTFGSIHVLRLVEKDINVAVKVVDESSSQLAVACEVKIMKLVSHHPHFPVLYGLLDPHSIVMEDLGWRDERGNYCVSTIQNTIGNSKLSHVQWVIVARQLIEGIIHLHYISILHNALKGNNVILVPPSQDVKIIDFGKATLLSSPRTYYLDEEQKKVYNSKHRYLAHELRNVYGTSQSEETDTYSVGYMLKYIGIGEGFQFFIDTGRKMKDQCVRNRLSLSTSLVLMNNFRV